MKSGFTHWANLEDARDDSSMNLKKIKLKNYRIEKNRANGFENLIVEQKNSVHNNYYNNARSFLIV